MNAEEGVEGVLRSPAAPAGPVCTRGAQGDSLVVSRAVVSNPLCSRHPSCWCAWLTLLIIPLSAADSKYSIARGR